MGDVWKWRNPLPILIYKTFAKNTFVGSAILLDSEKSNNATSLRKNVTSPGGTTEAALKILMNEEEGLKIILKKAVLNAINRAHELKN